MKISEMFGGFLKAADLEKPIQVVIESVAEEEVGSGSDKEIRPVVRFRGAKKGLVLNKTNGEILAGLFGDETDDWIGKRIVLYNDKSILFEGRRGGIRVRIPAGAPAPAARRPASPPQPPAEQEPSEEWRAEEEGAPEAPF